MINLNSFNNKFFENLLLLLFCVILSVILCLFLVYANKGFDITDESYAFLWSFDPESVVANVSSFGFMTHFFWLISDSNISFFRAISILLVFGFSFFFAFQFNYFFNKKFFREKEKIIEYLSIVSLSTAGFNYFVTWLVSANYNLLAFIACLSVMSGLLMAYRSDRLRLALIGGVLVGFGVGLALFVKITTGVGLALVIIAWGCCYWGRRYNICFLGTSVFLFTLMFLLNMILVNKGVWGYFKYVIEGVEISKILIPKFGILESIKSVFSSFKDVFLNWMSLVFFISFLAAFFIKKKFEKRLNNDFLIAFLISFNLILFFIASAFSKGRIELMENVFIVTVVLPLYVFLFKKNTPYYKDYFLLFFTLFFICFSYAFGTSNAIFGQIFGAVIFLFSVWLYTFKVLLINSRFYKPILIFYMLLILIVTIAVMVKSYNQPYRLGVSLGMQNQKVSFLSANDSIYVDERMADYVNQLKKIALDAGWIQRSHLIDLTGGSPGALVILNAKIVGSPWFLGGYEGSEEFAKQLILRSGVDPFSSWILTAPRGKLSISTSVLSMDKFNFQDKFKLVGIVKTGHRNEEQYLWKPNLN